MLSGAAGRAGVDVMEASPRAACVVVRGVKCSTDEEKGLLAFEGGTEALGACAPGGCAGGW